MLTTALHKYFAHNFNAAAGQYDPSRYRPILQKDGNSYLQVNDGMGTHGKNKNLVEYGITAANASLPLDSWKYLMDTIDNVRRERITGVDDLEKANLTVGLNDGQNIPGATIFQSQKQSDEGSARLSMSGTGTKQGAHPDFDIDTVPLPFTQSDFQVAVRLQNAGLRGAYGNGIAGFDIDKSEIEKLTRRQRELQEDLLFGMDLTGAGTIETSPYTYGGGSLYGYLNFPTRETGTFSGGAWTAATGAQILADVLAMITKMNNNKYYANFVLYVPTAYNVALDADFKTDSDKTIRQRLLDIPAIKDIRAADRMVSNHVVMVAMESSNVRLINGMDMLPIRWNSGDELTMNMKLLSIKVPQIRDDYNGSTGVVDYTTA